MPQADPSNEAFRAEPARWASVGIIIRALYKFGEVWRNGNRAMRQAAGILIEKLQANSAKSLANVSCHERGKKYLPWQNASNAEPPPGIAEPHLVARGRALSIGPNGQVQARGQDRRRPAQSGLGSLFLTLPTPY